MGIFEGEPLLPDDLIPGHPEPSSSIPSDSAPQLSPDLTSAEWQTSVNDSYGIPTDALPKMCHTTEVLGIDLLWFVLTCNEPDSQ